VPAAYSADEEGPQRRRRAWSDGALDSRIGYWSAGFLDCGHPTKKSCSAFWHTIDVFPAWRILLVPLAVRDYRHQHLSK
jgi:hypothetical protein